MLEAAARALQFRVLLVNIDGITTSTLCSGGMPPVNASLGSRRGGTDR